MQYALATYPALREAARALGASSVTGDHAEINALLAEQPREDVARFFRALATDDPLIAAEITVGAAFAPGGSWWREAAGLRARMDAAAQAYERQRKAIADPRRRRITGAAFTALRNHVPTRDLLLRLHLLNAELTPPLPPTEIDRLAVWCAERARESAHA